MDTKNFRLMVAFLLSLTALAGCGGGGGGTASAVSSGDGAIAVQGLTAPAQVPLANAN